MKNFLSSPDKLRAPISTPFFNFVYAFLATTSLLVLPSIDINAQCTQSDIVVSTNTTWTNQIVTMTEDQKIIVTNGATLTMSGCIVRRKLGCSGYWDGIHLVTDESGDKSGLVLNGTRIEFSKNGIQALNGFSEITLDDVDMSDNGRMILARDHWPFALVDGDLISTTTGNPTGPVSVYAIGCTDLLFPAPPKVIIRNNSILKVLENGNTSVNPPKFDSQINVLGAELNVIGSQIINGQTQYVLNAIAASRGKCKIYGKTKIDGFWIGVYKGSDASAQCVSEGLVMTDSESINTDLRDNIDAPYPGAAIFNVSSDVMIKNNILEANVYSNGTCYGSLIKNNIYYDFDEDVSNTSVYIINPSNSFVIFDNGFKQTPLELASNNILTTATCNTWIDETYAFVANGDTRLPKSWGTLSGASGNEWEVTKSEMYNLSIYSDLRYYYLSSETSQIFDWYDGIIEMPTAEENSICSYVRPINFVGLDPDEYVVSIEGLEEDYGDVEEQIESIVGHMDTSLTSVKDELAFLYGRLNDIVGQGLLFHTTADSAFWTAKVDPKIVELLGLNYLWFGHDMYSITEHLDSNIDPDAEALYNAAAKMSNYFDNGKNLYNLTNLQVDTLQSIAESSYGDYTNLLRNYLYMVYEIFIPAVAPSLIDSLKSSYAVYEPANSLTYTQPNFTIAPNPFTDDIQIISKNDEKEDTPYSVFVYNLEGKLVYSSLSTDLYGQLNLSMLEPGFFIFKIENKDTGEIEIQRIYKDQK